VGAAGELHDLRAPRVHGQQLQDVARVLDAPRLHEEQRVEHLRERRCTGLERNSICHVCVRNVRQPDAMRPHVSLLPDWLGSYKFTTKLVMLTCRKAEVTDAQASVSSGSTSPGCSLNW